MSGFEINYTVSLNSKLNNIEDNANNYVLPSDVVQDSSYIHTDNNYTNDYKDKLDNIEDNANNYTLPSDVVQDNSYESNNVLIHINSDTAVTITPPRKGFILNIIYNPNESPSSKHSGIIYIDCGSSPSGIKLSSTISDNIDISTGSLSGTDGTDGNITIGVSDNGTFDIENRATSSDFHLTFN